MFFRTDILGSLKLNLLSMKKVLLHALVLTSLALYSCEDEDEGVEFCTMCTNKENGTTMDFCGSEEFVEGMENDVNGPMTCVRM